MGFDTYGKYSEGETIVYFDYDKEIVSCIEPNNIEHEFEGYTRVPPTEFLSRMEGTWEQSAENAQSNHSEIPNSSERTVWIVKQRGYDPYSEYESIEGVYDNEDAAKTHANIIARGDYDEYTLRTVPRQ